MSTLFKSAKTANGLINKTANSSINLTADSLMNKTANKSSTKLFTSIKNKLRSAAGETLVEVMASILIFTLSSIILYSMVTTATSINETAREYDKDLSLQLEYAEKAEPANAVTVAGSTTCAVITVPTGKVSGGSTTRSIYLYRDPENEEALSAFSRTGS